MSARNDGLKKANKRKPPSTYFRAVRADDRHFVIEFDGVRLDAVIKDADALGPCHLEIRVSPEAPDWESSADAVTVSRPREGSARAPARPRQATGEVARPPLGADTRVILDLSYMWGRDDRK